MTKKVRGDQVENAKKAVIKGEKSIKKNSDPRKKKVVRESTDAELHDPSALKSGRNGKSIVKDQLLKFYNKLTLAVKKNSEEINSNVQLFYEHFKNDALNVD